MTSQQTTGILTAPLLTSTGSFRLDDISPVQAADLLRDTAIESTLSPEAAKALTEIVGFEIPSGGKEFTQQCGQRAIIFSQCEDGKHYSFQLLTRIDY